MAAPSATPETNRSLAKSGRTDKTAPPDERFWVKYSPHHEFPLSSVVSVAAHVLAVVLILVIALLPNINTKPKPPEMVIGGDDTETIGDSHDNAGGSPQEAQPTQQEPMAKDVPQLTDPVPVVTPMEAVPQDFEINPNDFVTPVETDQSKQLRDKLRDNLAKAMSNRPAGNPGKGGDGGGTGTAQGTGSGRGGEVTKKRAGRWTMSFNTLDGNDYLNQLSALGAILGFPLADGETYHVVRNLRQRPAQPQVEDVTKIDRIFWIDSDPRSLDGVARALGLPGVPSAMVAFFPNKLEEELKRKELAYASTRHPKRQRVTEDDIATTRFGIAVRGNGYSIQVLDMRFIR